MTHSASIKAHGRLELVIFTWGGEPQRHRLPVVGQVSIGRDPRKNHICIEDLSVSADHAILTVDSTLQIHDVGSTNGTIIRKGDTGVEVTKTDRNDERRLVGESVVIEPGNRIIFGSVMAIVRLMQWPLNTNASEGEMWPHAPIVQHPVMQSLHADARKVAASASRACVLLQGETGVGKDMLAHVIHSASSRAKGGFVEVNCGAIVASVLESAFFGHKKGAFTGATNDAKGYFDAAHGGTLFLDEVGELPLDMQVKLLKVLDNQQITPVGSTESHQVNVRIIAATNRNLQECVEQGTFRRDLFYRLRGFELEIPPLRARPTDIVPLAEAFIEHECRLIGQLQVPLLSPEAIAVLEGHQFPGNVRELRTAMMTAVAYCSSGGVILPEHLPKEMRDNDKTDPMLSLPFVVQDPIGDDVTEEERIRQALGQCGGNARRAAELLGISRRTIFNKMNKMDVPRSRKGVVSARSKN